MLYSTPYEKQYSTHTEDFFGNRRVLFFVPHEDDDSNLAQGVIEQYVDAGSEVYVAFMTNGDCAASAETRIGEAVRAEASNGVPDDHLIFLGYGNEWDEEISGYDHIYDAPDDFLMTSLAGYQETYGTESVPDYHSRRFGEPAPYTRGALLEDIEDMLLEYRPDVIYCIDLDEHPDHRAASLAFETALGRILAREDNDYFPVVLKGFGYCTAWDGAKDYYGDIVPSTVNPADRDYVYNDHDDDPDYLPHMRAYNWSERVRIPVAARILAYTKRSSTAYHTLSAFDSQNAIQNFEKIVKADKVYWRRPTESLLYRADISATTGETAWLKDFKLYDTKYITDSDTLDNNVGVWVPDQSDPEKTVTVRLKEKQDIDRVILYDNDSLSDNITAGHLNFSDGTEMATGALRVNGSGTVLETEGLKDIEWFSFTIDSSEGERAGLTEMEAFHNSGQPGSFSVFKVTDTAGSFLYDVLYEKESALKFEVYQYPYRENAGYDLLVDGKLIGEDVSGEELEIANDFRRHTVEIRLHEDPSYTDTILLRPKTLKYRIMVPLLQRIEQKRDEQDE